MRRRSLQRALRRWRRAGRQTLYGARSWSRTRPRRVLYLAPFVAALGAAVLVASPSAPAAFPSAMSTAMPLLDQSAPAYSSADAFGPCTSNAAPRLVVVEIDTQQLTACQGSQAIFVSPVTTGAYQLGEATPTGTFRIVARETDTRLRGCDARGCWDVHVDFYLPFTTDQMYGFHDASWRPESQFGDTSIYPADGSRGCVEMPLQAVAWLYEWAPVGTPVVIEA